MKNKLFYIWLVIAFIIAIIGLFSIFGVMENNKEEDNNFVAIADDCIIENNKSTTLTSNEREVVSPNAKLIFKIQYSECGHTVERIVNVEKDLVNSTKEDVKKIYSDWIIEEFSSNEIIFKKNEKGLCNEHYILKIKNDRIAVYKNEFEEEELISVTDISIKYLPEEDVNKLNEGIKIYGKKELSKILEDYGNK